MKLLALYCIGIGLLVIFVALCAASLTEEQHIVIERGEV